MIRVAAVRLTACRSRFPSRQDPCRRVFGTRDHVPEEMAVETALLFLNQFMLSQRSDLNILDVKLQQVKVLVLVSFVNDGGTWQGLQCTRKMDAYLHNAIVLFDERCKCCSDCNVIDLDRANRQCRAPERIDPDPRRVDTTVRAATARAVPSAASRKAERRPPEAAFVLPSSAGFVR